MQDGEAQPGEVAEPHRLSDGVWLKERGRQVPATFPRREHLNVSAVDVFDLRQLCHAGPVCIGSALTENGTGACEDIQSPHLPTTEKEVIYIFPKKSFHPFPFLEIEASSIMDRLPPCGHKWECGKVQVTTEEEMPLGLNQFSSYRV